MSIIYDLSWNENGFLYKLLLYFLSWWKVFVSWFSINTSATSYADVYSAHSSTCYSIAGTAFKHLEIAYRRKYWWLFPQYAITWLPLGAWCYWRMLPNSDKVLFMRCGYEFMTAGQCDIRQSILRKRRRFDEAVRCIEKGLKKEVEDHTKGLLLIGLANCYARKRDPAQVLYNLVVAYKFASRIETMQPAQASRIYRGYASVVEFMQKQDAKFTTTHDVINPQDLRNRAKKLAETYGLEDQLLKLSA